MSMPKVPDVKPEIKLDTKDAVNVILASIGFEELGLAHIINAEGEKIQAFLGTDRDHEEKNDKEFKIDDLVRLDEIVRDTLDTIIKKEMLLLMKLDRAAEILEKDEHKDDEEKPEE